MEEFLEWLEERGASIRNSGVKPVFFEDAGWGIEAEKNFFPGSVIFRIPDNLLITSQTVLESPIGRFFQKNCGLFKPFEALTIWLCCEFLGGDSSPWHLYFRILPQIITNPVNYQDFSAESLPPSVIALFVDHKIEFARFFAKLTAVSSELLALDRSWLAKLEEDSAKYSLWDLLCWSWCMVNTRCMYKAGSTDPVFDNSDGDSLALVPFLDLLNHSPKTKVEAGYSKRRNCYELTCHSTISEGNQLFVCYGPHSNAKLFVEYGFVLPENPNNSIRLDIEDVLRIANKASLVVSAKHEQILRNTGFPCCIYEASEEPSWGLMAAFKVILMNDEELKDWQGAVYNRDDISDDIVLIRALKSVLSVYYSELEEKKREACLNEVPENTRPMVDQLWKDELGIVQQALDQLNDLLEDDLAGN